MAGLCKVSLIGNLGADPELRYSAQGKPVTKFRVACNSRKRTQRASGWTTQSGSG